MKNAKILNEEFTQDEAEEIFSKIMNIFKTPCAENEFGYDSKILGDQLKLLRKKLRYSIKQASDILQVDRMTITRREKGANKLSPKKLSSYRLLIEAKFDRIIKTTDVNSLKEIATLIELASNISKDNYDDIFDKVIGGFVDIVSASNREYVKSIQISLIKIMSRLSDSKKLDN